MTAPKSQEFKGGSPVQLVERLEKTTESVEDRELLRAHLKQLRRAWNLPAKEEAEAA
jgi:hypothetical protein